MKDGELKELFSNIVHQGCERGQLEDEMIDEQVAVVMELIQKDRKEQKELVKEKLVKMLPYKISENDFNFNDFYRVGYNDAWKEIKKIIEQL